MSAKIIKFRPKDKTTSSNPLFDFSKSPYQYSVSRILKLDHTARTKADDAADTYITELGELSAHLADPSTKYGRDAARIVVEIVNTNGGQFNEVHWRSLPASNFLIEMYETMIVNMSKQELRAFTLWLMETGLTAMVEYLSQTPKNGA